MSGSRDEVVSAATRLFAERGYAGTTIRDVAASAGLSPAMVMKVAGTKEELFRAATSFEILDLSEVADTDLARTLVASVVHRHMVGESDPLTRSVALLLPAPSRDEVRQRFTAALVDPLAERLGDRERAETVVALLLGLAVSVRMLGLLRSEDADDLVERWTRFVQDAIDG